MPTKIDNFQDTFEDYIFDELDVTRITRLFQMRHACNVLGMKTVAKDLNVTLSRVKSLYSSPISGSKELNPFFSCSDDQFKEMLDQGIREEIDRREKINDRYLRHELLITDLQIKRKQFAGLGTNKAKRRLNKLATTSIIAKALRIALEIEDKNISAKNSYGEYREKIYDLKQKLIVELCQIFKEQSWKYGIQKSEVPAATAVIYFEIPTCEQISWHFSPENEIDFPLYDGTWDKKENSTLAKLEAVAVRLLSSEQ
jgi:hypothetical protein